MKKRHIIPILLAGMLVMLTVACHEKSSPVYERVIVYTVDDEEQRVNLTTEAEWEELIDKFCSYAHEGKKVTFYNIKSQNTTSTGETMMLKDAIRFSTTSREKMREWMATMERDGKTVNVSYDETTGEWHGTAYATMPIQKPDSSPCYTGVLVQTNIPALTYPGLRGPILALKINDDTTFILGRNEHLLSPMDEIDGYSIGDTVTLCGIVRDVEALNGETIQILDITQLDLHSIIGSWHVESLLTSSSSSQNNIWEVTIFIPEEDDMSITMQFLEGGQAYRYIRGSQEQTASDTWSLSSDGMLCCTLFPHNSCWNVNWISNQTMVLSCESENENHEAALYQLQLEKSNSYDR